MDDVDFLGRCDNPDIDLGQPHVLGVHIWKILWKI